MNLAVESIVDGVLRASLGLSFAAVAIGLLSRLLKPRSPRLEQWAWGIVLFHGVIVTPLVLSIPIPWPDPAASVAAPTPNIRTVQHEPAVATIESSSDVAVSDVPASPPLDFVGTGQAINAKSLANLRESQPADSAVVLSWRHIAFLVWVSGIVLLAGVGGLRYAAFARRIDQSGEIPEEWLDEWRHVWSQMAVVKNVPLVVTDLMGPALVRLPSGYRLVVPRVQWAQLSSVQRRAILRHEAAHLQRGDVWTALIARTVGMIHWFNPFAWWAVRRFEAQAELACDRIAAGDEPTIFAEALFKLGAARSSRISGAIAVKSGSLSDRVKQLLSDAPGSPRWKRAAVIAVAVMALLPAAIRVQGVTYAEPKLESVATEESSQLTEEDRTPVAEGVRQAKKLLQIGTNDLRTSHFIHDMAFSRDGKFIAAAPANTPHAEVELFDVATGKSIKLIQYTEEKSGWIHSLDISIDDTKLLWGEGDGYVALWDLKADRLIFRERLHRGAVNDVAFSYWGNMFASAGQDGVVHLRQTDNPAKLSAVFGTGGERPRPFPSNFEGEPGASCLAFSRDDKSLIAGTSPESELSFWRIDNGQLVRRIERVHGERLDSNSGLNHLAVTPDNQLMTVGRRYVKHEETDIKDAAKNVQLCEIRLWDIESGTEVSRLNGPEDYGNGFAALSSDATRVAVMDYGRLRIIDAKSKAMLRTIELPGHWGNQPEFSPDGNIVAVPLHNAVAMFDVNTGERLHHSARTPAGSIATAAWSQNGQRIVSSHDDRQIRVWDARTGEVVWHKPAASELIKREVFPRAFIVAFTHSGDRVIAAGARSDADRHIRGFVTVFDAATGNLIHDIPLEHVYNAAVSPDDRMVVAAAWDGGPMGVHLYGIDLQTGEILYVSPPADQKSDIGDIEAMRFLPLSTTLALISHGGKVIQFDGMIGEEKRRFLADWRTPEQLQANRPKDFQIVNAAFTTDGGTLVTSSEGGIHVWDVKAGRLKHKIQHPHDGGFCSLAISPDAKTVATADMRWENHPGMDIIRVFDINTGELLMTAEPENNRAGILSFSPDGTKLFTGYWRGSAEIWDVR